MPNPTVIVTGCAGFIGFWLSKALLEEGYDVVGVDCPDKALDRSLFERRLNALKGVSNFSFLDHDLANSEIPLSLYIRKAKFVIHLAARGGVRRSSEYPLEYVQNNIRAQQYMLSFCEKLPNLEHFLYASSSSVYGDNAAETFKEDTPIGRSTSLYAMTKAITERLAALASGRNNFLSTGFRFFTVYGPLGRPDMAYGLFLNALRNKKKLTLWKGEPLYRDFTYIDDVVSAILAVMKCQQGRCKNEILNIGSSSRREVGEMLGILERELQQTAEIEYKERPATELMSTQADTSKIRTLTGWNPKFSLESGLSKVCNYDSNAV